jgi:hypothetical protein
MNKENYIYPKVMSWISGDSTLTFITRIRKLDPEDGKYKHLTISKQTVLSDLYREDSIREAFVEFYEECYRRQLFFKFSKESDFIKTPIDEDQRTEEERISTNLELN